MQMFQSEQLQEKWAPLLNYDGLDQIKDPHKRMVTAVLLENQETALREEREFLSEAVPTNSTATGSNPGFSASAAAGGPTAGFDPVEDLRYIWSYELKVLGANGWMREELEALISMIDVGRLDPIIDRELPLEKVNEGFRLLEEREVFGKVVVRPCQGKENV